MFSFFIQPFIENDFLRRALVACLWLSLSAAPFGVFLVLRRMTLIGDAISHAILPGVAISFIFFGLSLWHMTLFGFFAAITVVIIAGGMSRITQLKEESSFTGIYLISLAVGVLILSLKGQDVEIIHMLFGDVMTISKESLLQIVIIVSISTIIVSVIYRSLVLECFDPFFMRSIKKNAALIQQLYMLLLVLNLICAFQVLGTLMAVGLFILPAISTRFWTQNIDKKIFLSFIFAFISSYFGLVIAYHYELPSGAVIVLSAAAIKIFSVCFGNYYSLRVKNA